MARRKLLTTSARQALFGIPTDTASLEKYYAFRKEDLEIIASRRRHSNQLGLAIHLALLRHPGQGWIEAELLPDAFLNWIATQLGLSAENLEGYGSRPATRMSHRSLAMSHLDLKPFSSEPLTTFMSIATLAAFDTDDGRIIMERLVDAIRTRDIVLPSTDTLERIGIAGRARARRLAATSIVGELSGIQKRQLSDLLNVDPKYRKSPLAWLRAMPYSNSAASLRALLERLAYVRQIGLAPNLGDNIHPARLTKFAREGAVAPAQLLSDFGERRRLATLAAQMVEMNVTLTDASIAMFERLTGQLFTNSRRSQDKSYQASKSQVARLMKIFAGTLDGLARARATGDDIFEVLDNTIGWNRLMNIRPEVSEIAESTSEDPLALASKRYAQLRRFAPAFLEAFSISVPDAGVELHAAINLLREHNLTGKRKLPENVPMPFPVKHWKGLIFEGGKPVRRVYETAVISTLRDRLRAGDAWVEGSRDYRRFDTYLLPSSESGIVMTEAGFQTNGPMWLKARQELLSHRLDEVQTKLRKNQLEGVRLENGRLKITPHDPITPKTGEDLDRSIDALMPRIRITELLWDVANRTGFLEAFTDLRSGRSHENPAAILASILAGATNLGLERMAQASKSVSHAQLSWASNWHLRPETYSEALSRIIDAHHELPFAKVWGNAESTSSDGQFFPSGRNTGEINAKYGPDPGLKIYSFLSGQYGSFHSSVIGATSGEAPYVLDGLMGNAAQFNPLIHHVDTGGVSDHVFALFYLLQLQLAPRLRDFPDRRLGCFGKPRDWKGLRPLIGNPINEAVIRDHWGDVLRLAASVKTGAVKPSALLKKLGTYRQQNRLYLALGEIGRIERTLFMLDWMENPQLRKDSQAGLNKGEARHSLAKAVFAHSQGRILDRSDAAQQKRAMALNLVIAAIIYWNSIYIEKAADHMRRSGQLSDSDLLKHVSPLGWEHINLTGDFDWHSGAADRSNARPLHLRSTRRKVS